MTSPTPGHAAGGRFDGAEREVLIGLGSNLGDRAAHLRFAVESLSRLPRTRCLGLSRIYETEPVGPVPQGLFLNAVVLLASHLPSTSLLSHCLAIEAAAGRVRGLPSGPRTLDLDLLWIDGEGSFDPTLCLPHPRITERAFVLAPLCDLRPETTFRGTPAREWLATVDCRGIRPTDLSLDPA